MEKHSLLNEFPEFSEKIHEMKTENAHFRKIFDEYHEIEHEIHRIKTGAESTTDEVLNQLKIKLLQHKDILYQMLIN